MNVTNNDASDFYRYADHVKEEQKCDCIKSDGACYYYSLKGRAELWDNQREAYHKGNYKECVGWSLAQRGAWILSFLIDAPSLLCIAGSSFAGSLSCLCCATCNSVFCCTRSVICCCDEESQKLATLALATLFLSGLCCCLSGCICSLCIEETVIGIPTVIVPECTLSMNVTGCLEKQRKTVEDVHNKINSKSRMI